MQYKIKINAISISIITYTKHLMPVCPFRNGSLLKHSWQHEYGAHIGWIENFTHLIDERDLWRPDDAFFGQSATVIFKQVRHPSFDLTFSLFEYMRAKIEPSVFLARSITEGMWHKLRVSDTDKHLFTDCWVKLRSFSINCRFMVQIGKNYSCDVSKYGIASVTNKFDFQLIDFAWFYDRIKGILLATSILIQFCLDRTKFSFVVSCVSFVISFCVDISRVSCRVVATQIVN